MKRYQQQMLLPEIGEAGQEKLINAKILLVGAGGLGTVVATYLAAMGIGTIRIVDFDEIEETNLVFGSPSKEDKDKYTTISYESEVFDFLLFELSKELKDNANILQELKQQKISRKDLEPILKKWFDSKITYVSDPIQFVSKVRTPCGQLKNKETCESANMCGWNGKTCGINVNEKLRNSNLFHRLLTTLVENSKLRAIVLDGRVTPFFSTILYLELPNELILTDFDIRQQG
jgi:hypothetical protein